MKHIFWPLHGFDSDFVKHHPVGTRYPIKLLRYWFARMVLEDMHRKLGRPVSVLEVGVGDDARMAGFMGGPKTGEGRYRMPDMIERWDGVDVNRNDATLQKYSYSDFIQADIEKPFDVKGREYDAVILLHILEHLFDPEAVMLQLTHHLKKGGVLVGGSPTMPRIFAAPHEAWLRRSKFKDKRVEEHRHLSVISPGRVRDFAGVNGLEIDMLTGTFMVRWSGLPVENSAAWVRANLLWGALFPSLGGEVYFSLRKS